MKEAEAFLERIRQQPDEDGPRLIYADWLDERRDPRGEFIRIQCALARLAVDDPRRFELMERERRLYEQYKQPWQEPLRGIGSSMEFRRGFVEVINIEARVFLSRADEIFARTPLRHVRLLDVGASLNELARCPRLRQLAGLTMYAQHLGDRLARILAESEHLSEVRILELGRNRLGDRGVEALALSPFLCKLEQLDLSDNAFGDLGVQALAAAPNLRRLQRLELQRNEISGDGLEALAAASRLPGLCNLGLSYNRIGTLRRVGIYGNQEDQPRLRHLDVRSNIIHPSAIGVILSSSNLTGLYSLDLGNNQLGNEGIQTLTNSATVASLRHLFVNDNQLGNDAITALARSPYLHHLTTLDLHHNPMIFDAGAQLLLNPRFFRHLRRLGPPSPGISHKLRRLLQARYGMPLRM